MFTRNRGLAAAPMPTAGAPRAAGMAPRHPAGSDLG
jgi:hypothetical protein